MWEDWLDQLLRFPTWNAHDNPVRISPGPFNASAGAPHLDLQIGGLRAERADLFAHAEFSPLSGADMAEFREMLRANHETPVLDFPLSDVFGL